jgi:response regulator RpfG family c-di-GMP phosphodiesterase
MALFQDTGDDPRAAAAQLSEVLAFYGALGDVICGNPTGFAARKAATAASIAEVAHVDDVTRDAIYFAGLLHAVGALGNTAYRKGERLTERLALTERWDIPAQGARICETIVAMPAETSDIVRWQAECWDGTGYPDQLRWFGIPRSAQLLAVADAYLRAADPDEALGAIGLQSGRAFGPETVRAFTAWFHISGGEEPTFKTPLGELHPKAGATEALVDNIASLVDRHNSVAGRWQRVTRLTQATAQALQLSDDDQRALAVASRLYGCGEITERNAENTEFDPLSRLGIEERARNANAAAALLEPYTCFAPAANVARTRSEWFDGTGKPRGLRQDEVGGILAAAIAYDSLERATQSLREGRRSAAMQLESAAGTQFAPGTVSALLEAAKAYA